MKLFVISDTHGEIEKVKEVYKKLNNVDLIVHLGDYQSDSVQLQKELDAEVISVKGNLDEYAEVADDKILETEWGRILLTHGHMDKVKYSPLTLSYKARELGCKAALFGHTHIPFYSEENGLYLLNPGSLSKPRDGSKGSYAIITTSKTEFNSAIVYYSSLFPKKQQSSGILRDLLNNSDRF